MKAVKVKSNTLLCKQGQECKNVYFIKNGGVKIVRDVAFYPLHKYESTKAAHSNGLYKEDPLATHDKHS